MATLTEKMDQVLNAITELDKKLAVHIAAQQANDELLKELELSICGNGKPGIDKRLNKVETTIKWVSGAVMAIAIPILGYLGTIIAQAIFK